MIAWRKLARSNSWLEDDSDIVSCKSSSSCRKQFRSVVAWSDSGWKGGLLDWFWNRKPGFGNRKPGVSKLTFSLFAIKYCSFWQHSSGRANKSKNSCKIFLGEIRVRIEITARKHWLADMELVSEQLIIYVKNFHPKFPFLTSTSFWWRSCSWDVFYHCSRQHTYS